MKDFAEFESGMIQLKNDSGLSSSELARLAVGHAVYNMYEGEEPNEEKIANFLDACQSVVGLAELVNGAAAGEYTIAYSEEEQIFVAGHPQSAMDLSGITLDFPCDKDSDLLMIAHLGIDIAKRLIQEKEQ